MRKTSKSIRKTSISMKKTSWEKHQNPWEKYQNPWEKHHNPWEKGLIFLMILPASQGPNCVLFSTVSFGNLLRKSKLPSHGVFQEANMSIFLYISNLKDTTLNFFFDTIIFPIRYRYWYLFNPHLGDVTHIIRLFWALQGPLIYTKRPDNFRNILLKKVFSWKHLKKKC